MSDTPDWAANLNARPEDQAERERMGNGAPVIFRHEDNTLTVDPGEWQTCNVSVQILEQFVEDHNAQGVEIARLEAERARLHEHSVLLNSIAWKIADALGDIPAGAEAHHGDVTVDTGRLIAKAAELDALIERLQREAKYSNDMQGYEVHQADACRTVLHEHGREFNRTGLVPE